MELDLWPLDDNIAVKNINFKKNTTYFYVNIKFRTEDKIYYIAQQFIDLYDWNEDLDNENICPITYSRVSFNVNAIDLSHKEITNILVNFLAHYKLYLHHFSIVEQETYVSYTSPEAKPKTFDLTYEPAYQNNSIFIDAEVQLEDNVDYYKLLGIKTKKPVENISGKKLRELGYKFNDYGIYNFAILDDEDAKKYLAW